MVPRMRNMDDYIRIVLRKVPVVAIATCSQDFSTDDTGERIETPICKDENAR